MNILNKALDHIKFSIPIEILKLTFNDNTTNSWKSAPISLDQQILNKVIRPRVLIDADLVGGQTIIVSLEGLTPKYVDTYTIIYEVPEDRLMYRSLISVLSIGYLPFSSSYNAMGAGMGTVNPNSMSDVLSAGQRMGDSMSNIPPISNSSVELIGANTILVRDQLRVTNAYQLRCVVGNDENLNNISPRSYLAFAQLCELAVKAYIYNTQLIPLDQGFLQGGQNLGSVKSYIDELRDSNEMYMQHLKEVWTKTAKMNDMMEYTRFIKLQICPAI